MSRSIVHSNKFIEGWGERELWNVWYLGIQEEAVRVLEDVAVDGVEEAQQICLRLTTMARPLPRIVDEYTKIESRRQRSLAGSSQRHELQAGRAT